MYMTYCIYVKYYLKKFSEIREERGFIGRKKIYWEKENAMQYHKFSVQYFVLFVGLFEMPRFLSEHYKYN